MTEQAEVIKRKCAVVFIQPDDTFSLICYFCDFEFFELENLRAHLNDSCPKFRKKIRNNETEEIQPAEISEQRSNSGSDCETEQNEGIQPDGGSDSETEQNEGIQPNGISELESKRGNNSEHTKGESLLIDEPVAYYANTRNELNEPCKTLSYSLNNTADLPPCSATEIRSAGTNSLNSHKADTKCSFCRKIFRSKHDLMRHEIVHTGKRPHICHLCSRTFGRATHLSNHITAIHTKDPQHECSVCMKKFNNKYLLGLHTREKHLSDTDPKRYFPCKLCTDKFDTSRKLSCHKLRKHKKNVVKFMCDYCERDFSTRCVLIRHMQIHVRTENFGVCGKVRQNRIRKPSNSVYEDENTIRGILESLLSEEPGNVENIQSGLTDGENNNESPSGTVDAIRNDSSEIPKSRKGTFKCNICFKIFTAKAGLNDHNKIHSGLRPFKCHLCSKTFYRRSHLSGHIRAVHTDIRPHECSVCKKGFVTKTYLAIHTREKHLSNTDPRSYFPCRQCDEKFKTRSQLSKHLSLIHNREKHLSDTDPQRYFRCKLCNDIFETNLKLNGHKLRKHKTNVAKFMCDYCQQDFTARGVLIRHMQIHVRTKYFGL